jgi:hypothetical protein
MWERIVHPSGVTVSSIEVEQFEAELGFPLPEDYRNFILTLNGGKVSIDHDIPVEGLFGAAFVHYLYPFSKPSPFLGIKEARKQQECSRLCLRQAIEIGDDMGTGAYYIILDGPQRGAIYFIFNEARESLSQDQWDAPQVRIPRDMILVAPDFDSLGEAILANAKWETEDQ